MQNNETEKKTSESFFTRLRSGIRTLTHPSGSRHGTVAAGMIALAVIVVILLNLALGAMDSSIFDFDISDQSIYEISQVSRDFAKTVEEDVDFILIGVEENIDTRVSKFVTRYAELNEHFHVYNVNPVTNPSVLNTYECPENVVVVKNAETGKFTYMPMTGTTDGAFIVSYLDYNTYTYKESYFDGEGLMTSAVEYVTTEATNVIYTLSGHGEAALSSSVQNLIRKANITNGGDLDLLMAEDGVPKDCDTLIINHPSSDIAESESPMLERYLRSGGTMIVLSDDETLTNLNDLLSKFGLAVLPGQLGDTERYFTQFANTYGYFATSPVISSESLVTMDMASAGNALVMYPHACRVLEKTPSLVTYETLLSTSKNGIIYTPVEGSDTEYDTEIGTFDEIITATIVLQNNPDDNTANLTLISCPYLIDSSITDSFPNMLNLELFMRILTYNLANTSSFSILAKSLETTYVTIPNSRIIMMVFIVVLPVAIFVTGIVIWVRRRKR